jgi:hypothetical protein
MNAEQVVQANLEAYNNRDIDTFMACFSPQVALFEWSNPLPRVSGLDGVRARYSELFAASPNLHSTILQRIVCGNAVIDHEQIVGRDGSADPYYLVLIYEVQDGKIEKITSIRP